jgi:osmotically inducible lipoprotein OsmB
MRKFLAVLSITALGFGLAGCQTTSDRALGGALIGGGTGAVIGGAASRSAGGAVAGGLIGAAAGAMIGAATAQPCYVRTRSGRLREVPCR